MNIAEFVNRTCKLHRDLVALEDSEASLTYGELLDRSNRVANALLAEGLPQGGRVAVLTGNRREWFEVTYGLVKSGLVRTYIHPRAVPAEVRHQLSDSGARTIIVGPEHRALIDDCDLDSSFRVIEIGQGYEDWLASASPDDPRVQMDDDDLVALTYTSGTTGKAKGVMWSHRTVMGHTLAHLLDLELGDGEVFLHTAPLSHATSAYILPYMHRGAKQIIRPKFSVDDVLRRIVDDQPTATMLIPAMLYMLLEALEDRELGEHSLRRIIYGGSSIAPEKLKTAMKIFGPVFHGAYGMTEAMCSSLRPSQHDPDAERIASVGQPGPLCEVKILGSDGEELPTGGVGEIVLRVAFPALGYWNQPEATAASWVGDGWFRTADMGRFDLEGNLYIVDRKSDLIISGGFNIYPREVEDVLLAHPDIAEAAVVGLPHERWGEAVHAVVRPMVGRAVGDGELRAWCRSRLADFKNPKSYTVVDSELPRSGTGKILRREVRSQLTRADA